MTIASPQSRNRPGHSRRTATGPACSCLAEQQSAGPIYNRSTPFPARLITSRILSGPASAKETRHFELSLSGSGITYEAGDSVGVWPTNCPALVNDIVSALGCDGEEVVAGAQGRQTSLRTALLRDYQLTQAPLNLLRVFAERSQDAQLNDLLQPENKAHLEEFLSGLEVIDLLLTLPSVKFTPQAFTGLLRKMQPRLYSISSSPKAHPD